ncbi:hypothetical protein DI041_00100 [Stenotrophomonas maltophilia]|uniref:hypothetical protein n=1 Tax=Stenotrophomonas maltophilia TaxID=40324 RepID=UPI0010A9D4EE|nr:hypothetical protein [Stenotrophomonas maltophilia]TIE21830.1 hypothetical protein DI034_01400 [Stenotrophomonas maltophilia]TIE65822.1 hypothetical protein DI041_00100 [Stenotrophomonas maltophilia]
MPPSPHENVDGLVIAFASLSKQQQKTFLDALNTYLYASPCQRKIQIQTMRSRLAKQCESDD